MGLKTGIVGLPNVGKVREEGRRLRGGCLLPLYHWCRCRALAPGCLHTCIQTQG